MSQPETTEAAPPRRKRRWLYPWNWRFWMFTLPVMFWTGLAILFFWPGISGQWSLGEWLKFRRERRVVQFRSGIGPIEADLASLRCGRLGIAKTVFASPPGTISPGFNSRNTMVAFGWSTGTIIVGFWGD